MVVTYNGAGTAPSNPGTYAVAATINDATYSGSASGTLTINKIPTTILGVNATANFSIAAQNVALTATVSSKNGAINDGTLTFQVLDGTNNVGTAVKSAALITGAATVTYSLPGVTLPGTYTIQISYSGGATFAASTDNAKKLLVSNNLNVGNPPIVKRIIFNRNPVRSNTVVTFTADAISSSDIPTLTYEWKFFDGNKNQDGATLTGNPISRSFVRQDNFTVIVVASDGVAKSASFTDITVTLDPNPGSEDKNIFNTGAASSMVVNPVNSLGVNVPDSLGGVINLDALAAGTIASRDADETYVFSTAGVQLGTNQFIAGKYTTPGIKIVEVNATKAGVTRKARLMLPIGDPETGTSAAITDTRSSKGTTLKSIKGKLASAKTSFITVNTSIEVAAGLTLAQSSPINVGVSNIFTTITLDKKGKVTSNSNSAQFKSVRLKLPKIDKATGKTATGATILFTMTILESSGVKLSAAGLDTEGIVPLASLKGQAQDRSLQFAAVVAGMSYVG